MSKLDRIVANLSSKCCFLGDDVLEDIKYAIASYALDAVYDSSILSEATSYCEEREAPQA